MANLNIAVILSAKDQGASGVIGGISKALGGLGTVAIAGAAVGIAALGAGLAISIDQGMKAQDVMAQTQAAITSTGGAAGVSAQQIADMATALQGQSRFSNLAIQSGENLLLTFTNIGKDTFPAATQAMVDMATAMHTDASGGAIQLGKALNDPTKGITALTRVGVTFTAQQKDLIKSLQASGDMAGAQKVILDELTKEFGGSAAASAKTFGGQLDVLKNTGLELAQAIGGPLLTVGQTLLDTFIMPALPLVENLANLLASQLTGGIKVVTDSISLFTDQTTGAVDVGGVISNILYNMGGAFADVGDAVVALTSNDPTAFFQAISSMFATLGSQIGPMIQPVITAVQTWITTNIPPLMATLTKWGQAFIAWIGPMIPPFLLELGKLEVQFITWLAAQVPPIMAQLQVWGQQLWAWVAPQIPPLIAEAQSLANQLLAWLAAQIPPLTAQLLAWGTQFVNWVGPQIPPLLAQLGLLLGQLVGWVYGTAVPAIVKQVAQWAVAFMDWVMKPGGAKDQLLPALNSFLLAVGKFVDTQLVPGFVAFAKSFIDGLLSGFNTNLPTLVGNVTDMGKAIISGIVAGINAAPGAVLGALSGIVDGAIQAIKDRLGIHSPSTVFAGIGQNMMAGLAGGIGGSMQLPQGALNNTINALVAAPAQSGNAFSGTIQVDARGSTLGPDAIQAAVERALQAAGYRTDQLMRMGVS